MEKENLDWKEWLGFQYGINGFTCRGDQTQILVDFLNNKSGLSPSDIEKA